MRISFAKIHLTAPHHPFPSQKDMSNDVTHTKFFVCDRVCTKLHNVRCDFKANATFGVNEVLALKKKHVVNV